MSKLASFQAPKLRRAVDATCQDELVIRRQGHRCYVACVSIFSTKGEVGPVESPGRVAQSDIAIGHLFSPCAPAIIPVIIVYVHIRMTFDLV